MRGDARFGWRSSVLSQVQSEESQTFTHVWQCYNGTSWTHTCAYCHWETLVCAVRDEPLAVSSSSSSSPAAAVLERQQIETDVFPPRSSGLCSLLLLSGSVQLPLSPPQSPLCCSALPLKAPSCTHMHSPHSSPPPPLPHSLFLYHTCTHTHAHTHTSVSVSLSCLTVLSLNPAGNLCNSHTQNVFQGVLIPQSVTHLFLLPITQTWVFLNSHVPFSPVIQTLNIELNAMHNTEGEDREVQSTRFAILYIIYLLHCQLRCIWYDALIILRFYLSY